MSNVQDENYEDPDYPSYIAGFYSSAYELYFDRNVMTIDAYDWGNRVGPNDSPWRPNDGPANDRPFLYEGVFAHEYQHLLHDDIDSDEENWINEGMSDFAEYLTGYSNLDTDGHITSYLNRPYNSLVAWGDRGDLEILADYGAAYLMQLYLNQSFGQEFIRALAWGPNFIRIPASPKITYDIEALWDFAFVQVSTDGGHSWTTVGNDSTTRDTDPNAHPEIFAQLPGLTGVSDGWVDMSFDLSAYDGQQILVAFRYMTDWASQGNGVLDAPGWYIDDIAISSFTSDGSSMAGFQGVDEVMERFAEYMITFVGKMKSGKAKWQVLHLDMQNFSDGAQKELKKFMSNGALEKVIVIVTHAAPQGTQSPAPFSLEVERRSDVKAKKK